MKLFIDILDAVIEYGVYLFSIVSIGYFGGLLFRRNRPRYLNIADNNDLDKAREMFSDDIKYAVDIVKIVTKTASSPVYNYDSVRESLKNVIDRKTLDQNKTKIIVGPVIVEEKDQVNALIELCRNKKITIKQLDKMPELDFRIAGQRLYIEEDHASNPMATRTFYRLHNVSGYLKKYNKSFDELWEKAHPLDLINYTKEIYLKSYDQYGKEQWKKEENS